MNIIVILNNYYFVLGYILKTVCVAVDVVLLSCIPNTIQCEISSFYFDFKNRMSWEMSDLIPKSGMRYGHSGDMPDFTSKCRDGKWIVFGNICFDSQIWDEIWIFLANVCFHFQIWDKQWILLKNTGFDFQI